MTGEEKTYDFIVRPEHPIPLSEIRVAVRKGNPFTLQDDRPDLFKQVVDYWNVAQAKMMHERTGEISKALSSGSLEEIKTVARRAFGDSVKNRLTRANLQDRTLTLDISHTSYRDFQGTNVQAIGNREFREQLKEAGLQSAYTDADHHFASPLACSTAVYGTIGSEKYAVVGLRSSKVMIYPNVFHVFGGLVDYDGKGVISIGTNANREIGEEAGLSASDLGSVQFHGLIRQGPSRIPEIVLSVPVRLEKKDLTGRWSRKSPDKFEHRHLDFVDFDDIPKFLEKYGQTMVPTCAAALDELYLRRDSL